MTNNMNHLKSETPETIYVFPSSSSPDGYPKMTDMGEEGKLDRNSTATWGGTFQETPDADPIRFEVFEGGGWATVYPLDGTDEPKTFEAFPPGRLLTLEETQTAARNMLSVHALRIREARELEKLKKDLTTAKESAQRRGFTPIAH